MVPFLTQLVGYFQGAPCQQRRRLHCGSQDWAEWKCDRWKNCWTQCIARYDWCLNWELSFGLLRDPRCWLVICKVIAFANIRTHRLVAASFWRLESREWGLLISQHRGGKIRIKEIGHHRPTFCTSFFVPHQYWRLSGACIHKVPLSSLDLYHIKLYVSRDHTIKQFGLDIQWWFHLSCRAF